MILIPAGPGIGFPNDLLLVHKRAFLVWIAVFAVHLLAHLRGAAITLWTEWRKPPGAGVDGTGMRTALLAAATAAGVGVALALLSTIRDWHGPDIHD